MKRLSLRNNRLNFETSEESNLKELDRLWPTTYWALHPFHQQFKINWSMSVNPSFLAGCLQSSHYAGAGRWMSCSSVLLILPCSTVLTPSWMLLNTHPELTVDSWVGYNTRFPNSSTWSSYKALESQFSPLGGRSILRWCSWLQMNDSLSFFKLQAELLIDQESSLINQTRSVSLKSILSQHHVAASL
jgi:hypothetical protein